MYPDNRIELDYTEAEKNLVKKVEISHYRFFDPRGVLQPKGGFTLGVVEANKGFLAALTYCRPTDLYNKKLGVAKVRQELLKELQGTPSSMVGHFYFKITERGYFRPQHSFDFNVGVMGYNYYTENMRVFAECYKQCEHGIYLGALSRLEALHRDGFM